MGKSKKSAGGPQKKSSLRNWISDFFGRAGIHILIAVTFVSGLAILIRGSQLYVSRDLAWPSRPLKVVLKNRPVWMSDSLAEQIMKSVAPMGLHSAFDHQLLVDTAKALQSNAWVRQVNQVRRVYEDKPGDTLEIDCDFRAPVALVKWGQYFWLVDGDAVKLPEQFTMQQLPKILFGPDGHINVRIIEGVAHSPTESGRVWPGTDLSGGLELAKLLAGRDCAEEIRTIDVSNFNARRAPLEAQIVLGTKYGTQVRWGRPPSDPNAFIEVPASVKLANMQSIFDQKKRIDAGQAWVDLRFDRVTIPSPAAADKAASETRSASADGQ
ncbi:MAG: hypothetical protein M3O30_02745 [Planctomycetota bacterium]|nr:hypothetical protein [Planctomycetota bacterium]